ncbi:hypothetical protein LBMAG18_05770 [Alphaproteobacteria bacterium]|nr:hypothetical protein LBMAG18_05770 [Alphaproteobacteria bacterium]
MAKNPTIINFFDKIFNNILSKFLENKICETNTFSNTSNSQQNNKNNTNIDNSNFNPINIGIISQNYDFDKNLKKLQLLLKVICLCSFIPYAIFGMFFINKSLIFIPCLVMATVSVLLTMYASIKIQFCEENFKNKLFNKFETLNKFLSLNQNKLSKLEGYEMVEELAKDNFKDFLSSDLITSTLIQPENKNLSSPALDFEVIDVDHKNPTNFDKNVNELQTANLK